MGTNKLKPFATSEDANVITDEQLAAAPELVSGFVVRSRADSSLVGKLFQDTSAASYALGQFVATNTDKTVTGTDPQGFADGLSQAVTKAVESAAPDLSDYSGETVSITGSGGTYGFTASQSNATIGSTANNVTVDSSGVTVNGTLKATVSGSLAGNATTATTLQNSRTIAIGGVVTGTATSFDGSSNITINTTSLNGNSPTATTLQNPRTIQLSGAVTGTATAFDGSKNITIPTTAVDGSKVTGTVPAATRATGDGDGNTISSTYLKSATASSTYATKSELNQYVPLAGNVSIAGDLTVEGAINATINGTTSSATKLATARTIALSGAVTGTATSFDGSKNITIPTTAVDGSKVTGTVANATNAARATADSDGNTITTTYVPVSQYNVDKSTFATTSSVNDALSDYMPLSGGSFSGPITVQNPTSGSNPATKQYVDSAVASVYKYKGNVASQSALPSSGNTVGDVWNVQDTGNNYAWTGTEWDSLAGAVDLSGYLTQSTAASTYLTKTDASSTYLTKSNATNTYLTKATASTTYATSASLSNYLTTSNASKTYLTKSGASSTYAPLASPTFSGTPKIGTNAIATTNQIPDVSSFITSSGSISGNAGTATKLQNRRTIAIGGVVTGTATSFDGSKNITINTTSATDSTKIALSGARGQLAGYETVSNQGAYTVTNTSPDSIESNGAITVTDGTSGQCWTKVVHCTAASPSVTLGSKWKWQNGSSPELKQNGFLILCWCSTMGLAIYNNVQ